MGVGSSITPVTCTPPTCWPEPERAPPSGSPAHTTCFALYGWPSGPVVLSTFARFEAVTFRRCAWADIAEPATLKMFNRDIVSPLIRLAVGRDRGDHRLDLARHHGHAGFEVQCVVGELDPFRIEVHRVAVERGLGGNPVGEVAIVLRTAAIRLQRRGAGHVARLGHRHRG